MISDQQKIQNRKYILFQRFLHSYILAFIYSPQLLSKFCLFIAHYLAFGLIFEVVAYRIIFIKQQSQAMDLLYAPPIREEAECNFLQENFLTCLKQKSLKDNVPEMKCNVQNILWFNLECPERFEDYRNPLKLRSIFTNVKKGKGLDRPAYVKL